MNRKHKIIVLLTIIVLSWVFGFFYLKTEKLYSLKQYYPDTKQTDMSEYVIRNGDTIFQGKFINYNEKGIKIAEGQFIDNEPNGICSYYYDSGKIESVHYRKNSKIIEESFFYNPNGLLEKYAIYDDFGKSSFIISFDEKGVKKYTGYPMLEVYQYKFTHKKQYNIKTEQVLKVGDTLKYKYLVANIPNAKRSLKIENISLDNTIVKRIITKKPPVGIDVKEIIIKKGINTIRAIVKYEFEDKITPTFNDTISFKVEVH
jgi:hypothetical protein